MCVGELALDEAIGARPAHGLGGPSQVAGLVLAAGGSRRFGSANKLLHRWRGRALVEHVLEALRASRIERVLVVTGDDRQAVEAVLSARAEPTARVHSAAWRTGLAASLACGVGALLDRPAVLVCLGDMPLVDAGAIDALLSAAAGAPERWLVIPVHAGRRGNPVLIRQPFYDAVLALEGDAGARVLAGRYPERVLEVELDCAGILRDVDTVEDAARLPVDADGADGILPG